jgi:uncharacterized membrane protein
MSNPIKPTWGSEIIPLMLILIATVAGAYFYFNLPAQVAIHWNFAGQPDAYGSGQVQAVVFPLIIVGMYLLFLLLPHLDPKKERYEQFRRTYYIFKNLILAMMAIIFFTAGLSNLGYNLPIGVIVPALIGLLFIIIGNYLGKIKMNWFVGIRTPWTLSSEEVWNKTHRFGGKMFILAGFLLTVEPILPMSWRLEVFIVSIAVIILGTVGYSCVVYLREKKNTNLKQEVSPPKADPPLAESKKVDC